jgi:hypothetical protein
MALDRRVRRDSDIDRRRSRPAAPAEKAEIRSRRRCGRVADHSGIP